ncbi:MAG: hypothetical protein AB1898_04455 [Acidobacteriota bacterium]
MLWRFLIASAVSVCAWWVGFQAQTQSPPGANPEDPNFNFSILYTGNVRGNLEPCG